MTIQDVPLRDIFPVKNMPDQVSVIELIEAMIQQRRLQELIKQLDTLMSSEPQYDQALGTE